MSAHRVDALVVGAGVAGLAAALDLSRAGLDVLAVDPADRVGGVMRSDRVRGYLVEAGPNTFLAKAPLSSFLARHGLDDALVAASPESRRRSLYVDDRLVDLPHGVGSAVATPLLSARSKLRMLAEPFVRAGDPTGESVHEFFARRLGHRVATDLVGAFLTGVYAGDERQLGIEAVFPALAAYEREHGSLARGGLRAMFDARAASRTRAASGTSAASGSTEEPRRVGSWSSPDGLGSFAARLASGLREPVRLATRLERLAKDGDRWRGELSGPKGPEEVSAGAVVLATPSDAAAALLRDVDTTLADGLASIEYAPVAAVSLGVDPQRVSGEISGFGFIVPRASGLKLLGCLFMSRTFPGRAPAGRELLHLMVGGVRWPEAVECDDEQLLAEVLPDLDRCLGLSVPPEVVAIRRWPRAIPQPGRDHTSLIAGLERRVASLAGLALSGSYLAGVSVSDTLASGVDAAARVLGPGTGIGDS